MKQQHRDQPGYAVDERVTVPGPPLEPPQELPRDARIGTTIGAGYVLRELVGQGGMARVYRAEQARLGRDVAIKLLRPHLLGDERVLAQFHIEARAASRLTHPNSVTVLDFGLDACKTPYLVMEFLRGQHLRSRMDRGDVLPPPTAVRLVLKVLSALSEAHARGVVHRDVKPENIFLVPRREGGHHVKVVDFGLARLTARNPSLPQPRWTGGTPSYAAPEQWLGAVVDGRTDLYALGVVLYELLAGQLPFKGDAASLVMRHVSERPLPPSAVAPGLHLPPMLDEIVRQALAKSPSDRFCSAEAMAAALHETLAGLDAQQQLAPACGVCGSAVASDGSVCRVCGATRALRATDAPAAPAAGASPQRPDRAERVSPFALLLASEQKERAAERSDLGGSIDACRRGLALARRARVSTGDEMFNPAMISFGTALGEVLARSGHLAEAEGVLREALPYVTESAPRARVLVLLGRVAAERGLREQAKSFLDEALAALSLSPDFSLAADIHEAHAAVCRDGGETGGAIAALRAACDALRQAPGAGERWAGARLALGLLLAEAGQPRQALVELNAALVAALHEGLSALAATCRQALGEVRAGLGSSASPPRPSCQPAAPPRPLADLSRDRSHTTRRELRAVRPGAAR